MNFLEQMKPKSTSEWLVIVLLCVMVVATAVLLITKPFNLAEGDVRLEVRTAESKGTEQSESGLLESGTAETSSQQIKRGRANVGLLQEGLLQLNTYQQDFVQKQIRPLMRNLQESLTMKEDNLNIAESIDPDDGLYGGNSGPLVEIDTPVVPTQENIVSPSETETAAPSSNIGSTQPGYTGPTSPPPLQNTPSAAPSGGPTSPPPLAQPQTPSRDPNAPTSPPPVGNNSEGAPGTQITSPAPHPSQTGNANTGGSRYDPSVYPTVMPSAEEIADTCNGILAAINAQRQAQGLPTLTLDPTLQQIANQRAQELSIHYHAGVNHHFRPDGSDALTYIRNAYGNRYALGECTAWIDDVQHNLLADLIYNEFYNSGRGHREIMMHPSVKTGAVGIYCVPGPVADNNTGRPNDTNMGRIFISMNFGY